MTDQPTETDEPPPPGAGNPAWLLTFTDLTALLLAFFVLLLSMTRLDVETWEAITQSLTRELNPAQWRALNEGGANLGVEEIFVSRAANLDYLGALMTEKVRDHPVLSRVRLTRLDDRLVLSLPGDLVFEPGQAALSPQGLDAAAALAEILNLIGNRVEIAGHTDPGPVATDAFPSNWELSLARAMAMSDALRGAGYEGAIAALGLADSRFGDLSEALGDEERLALARRVDVIIRENAGDAYAP